MSQAGGKIFISSNALNAQSDMNAVVKVWQSVHAPTYGLPIPSSNQTITTDSSALLTPTSNESAYITALSFSNADAVNPGTVEVTVDGILMASVPVGPSEKSVIIGAGTGTSPPFFLVGGQALAWSSATGTITASMAYSLSIQG